MPACAWCEGWDYTQWSGVRYFTRGLVDGVEEELSKNYTFSISPNPFLILLIYPQGFIAMHLYIKMSKSITPW